MDLYSYIKELLYQHDCVIIPEFGGFVANYRPARINHGNNTVFPPRKDISFNKSLTHNDGLLISYISESRGIGYVDSKRIVTTFVTDITKRLEKGKQVVFDNVGAFYIDSHRNLQFEPDPLSNFLLDSYGLSEFTFAPLEPYDVQKRIQKKFIDKKPVSIKTRRKVLWRVAIVIPVLVALVVVPLKTDWLQFRTNVSSMNPVSNSEVVDSNLEQPVNDLKNIAQEEENDINKKVVVDELDQPTETVYTDPVEMDDSETITSNRYFIIAGSFRNMGNAERFNEDLISLGYNSTMLNPVDGLHRVTLNGYPSKEEAVIALAELREDPSRQEMWILRNKE